MTSISPSRLTELAAKFRAQREAEKAASIKVESPVVEITAEITKVATNAYGQTITYNDRQSEFISLAASGESCILIGPAGTGKTTCMKGVVNTLISSGIAGTIASEDHRTLKYGSAGIVVCAYTRRAVTNIARNMPDNMKENCLTIHKLLEYEPVIYETNNEVTGETVKKQVFEPARNANNPLPPSIHTIIIEESSMLGIDLWKELDAACPHNPQFIFLGDIQQLPPVFGPAILGFKLLELPTVELTEVYRQALESPIIRLAHRILSGTPLAVSEFADWKSEALSLTNFKKKVEAEAACMGIGQFFINAEKSGAYSPQEDMILLPFNKNFGTIELNKIIANHLAKKEGKIVYEVIAGFNKHYFCIGEKILYDKEDAEVVSIKTNPGYTSSTPTPESATLDYWGHDSVVPAGESDSHDEDIDFFLSQVAKSGSDEDRVNSASHEIEILLINSGTKIILKRAAEVNKLLLGYALTVHKAQGSEWRRVFCVFHHSHATMTQRELLYTAVTRAREELHIICESDTFDKGIKSQRVKGNTLAEKAEYFKGKLTEGYEL